MISKESSLPVSPVGNWQLLVFGWSSCITDFESEPVSVPLSLLFFLRLLNFLPLHDKQIPHRFLTDGTCVWHLVHIQLFFALLSCLNKLDLEVSCTLLGNFSDCISILVPDLHVQQFPHRVLVDGTFVWHLVHAQLSALSSSLNKLDVSSTLLGGFAVRLPIRYPGFHDEQIPHRFLVDGIFVWQMVHVQSPALSALNEEDADLEVSFNVSGISFADLITALSDDSLKHSLLLPLPRFATAGALLLLFS